MDKNNSATPPGHVRKLNNMQEATKEYYKVRLYLKILAMSFFFLKLLISLLFITIAPKSTSLFPDFFYFIFNT